MEVLPLDAYADRERMSSLLDRFRKEFEGAEPQMVVRVPGRVNLIGEHIDYCGYAVHPMAIQQDVLAVLARSGSGATVLKNVQRDKYGDFETDFRKGGGFDTKGNPPKWWNYFMCGVRGAFEEVVGEGAQLNGFYALLDGRIPPSAGLSSSSALVVAATLCALWANDRLDVDPMELANLCARSERFIGTQGGGMDQAIAILAREGTAKLIEFNPLRLTDVSLPEGATFVIANSLSDCNKADAGGGSKFNVRVAECRLAAKVLGKSLMVEGWREISRLGDLQAKTTKSLCEMLSIVRETLHEEPYTRAEAVEVLELDGGEDELAELCRLPDRADSFELCKRASHVFGEAKRVLDFKRVCDSAAADDGAVLTKLGELMFASHESCAKLYDCSHPKLDELVELSNVYGALGARLTGAGWGGCIVALVPKDAVQDYVRELKSRYYSNVISLDCGDQEAVDRVIFPTKPGAGAQLFRVA